MAAEVVPSEDFALCDSDSEDELPAGWEERVTEAGKIFYACHHTKQTQWKHPITGRQKRVAAELPYGWESKCNSDGQVSFYNYIEKRVAHVDPRLAFKEDEKTNDGQVKQRFDASSTALQVLQGRDLTGQYVIVTGANSGIGFETARSLALHGAHVVLLCRNMRSGNQAVNSILQERPQAKVVAMYLDLMSLNSVKEFAELYISKELPLHILILNAGIFSVPYTLSPDGYEATFQTNHLGHFYLVQLLKDVLLESAPCRVVVVTSESHRFTDLNKDTMCRLLLSPPLEGFRSIFSYNLSKMCNMLFALELHRRLSSSKVCTYAVHPGNVIATGISRNWWLWKVLFTVVRPFAKSVQQGAATTVFCATAKELEGISGYYFNNCFQCTPAEAALDVEAGRRLWEISKRMVSTANTLNKRGAFDV